MPPKTTQMSVTRLGRRCLGGLAVAFLERSKRSADRRALAGRLQARQDPGGAAGSGALRRRGWLRLPAASAVVLAALGPPAALAQSSPEAARQALREGDRLWRLKRTRSALEAFHKAAARPELAAEAQERIGRIYLFKGAEAEGAFPGWHEEIEYREKALAAFEEALKREPASPTARLGRWRALKSLGRAGGDEPTLAPTADAASAEAILKLRNEKRYAELIEQAPAFAARFPESERLPALYDALLEAYQATPTTPLATLAEAIAKRIEARPDPGAYSAGANLLMARGALDQAAQLAAAMLPATETFVDENLDSYKLADKARGSLERARATSADLVGWTLFLKGDLAAAQARLLEADRLSRGEDFSSQFHLGELEAKRGAKPEASRRYLNALSLTGGPVAQRASARKALAELRSAQGQDAAGFDAWLQGELDRRREERRARSLRSMVDRPLPSLPLQSLSGEPADLAKLRGRVLLYKFFASW